MPGRQAAALKPRKKPSQARSTATVEAILEATIQILLKGGAPQLTTTRVAERTGVSVGTIYQYFPHKQALLYAVLQQHLDKVVEAIETTCQRLRGHPLDAMSDGLVFAYIEAKTGDIEVSRALYAAASELDTTDLIGGISQRTHAAAKALFATAPDAAFTDLDSVVFALRAALSGSVKAVFERGTTPDALTMLRKELPLMCRAYLQSAAQTGINQSATAGLRRASA